MRRAARRTVVRPAGARAPCRCAGVLLLVAALPVRHAAGHIGQGGVGASQIEVEATITDRAVSYDLHVPTRRFLAAVLQVDSMEAFRALDQAELTRRTESFFVETNRVQIDGITVRPLLQEMLLEVPDIKGLALSEDRMAFELGAIRCRMDFDTKGSPRSVGILWQLYLDAAGGAPAAAAAPGFEDSIVLQLNAGDLRRLVVLSRSEPEFVWHAEGSSQKPVRLGVEAAAAVESAARIPALGLAFGALAVLVLLRRTWAGAAVRVTTCVLFIAAGAATSVCGVGTFAIERSPAALSDEEAIEVFRSLHKNIYRAFDYTTESEVYDALATSVDGPQLDRIYAEVYESLILREEGGAVCRVQSVDVLAADLAEPSPEARAAGFAYGVLCRWRVHGLVRHWGHTHARTNEFQALYTIAARGRAWKIVHTDVRAQQRLDAAAATAGG